VPPSGILTTDERHVVTTIPFKTAPKLQTTKKATPVTMHHHVGRFRRAPQDDYADHDRRPKNSGHTFDRYHARRAASP
jgi:hypothetical protein